MGYKNIANFYQGEATKDEKYFEKKNQRQNIVVMEKRYPYTNDICHI